MMPSAASLASYPAFVDQLNSSRQFTPDSSVNNSSNSSIASSIDSFATGLSTRSGAPPLDLLIGDSFLQTEFQRNLAQFTNQLTMTGRNELLAASNGGEAANLQYSDEQLINSSNKKLSFSIDSLVNGKQSALNSALNKHAVEAAMNAYKGMNGTANLNSIKKESEPLSVQNLSHLSQLTGLGSAVAAAIAQRNGLPKPLSKDDLRGSISPNSPCSSTSSVCSDHNQKQQQQQPQSQNSSNHSSSQPPAGQPNQRTSANNSPRPASAASVHSNSASQLLNVASLANSYRDNESSSLTSQSSNSKNNPDKQAHLKERCRSPQTATNRSSPSFVNTNLNPHNNLNHHNTGSSIKNDQSPNLPVDALQHLQNLQQQQLRQQIQQQLQQVQCPNSALLHFQQQQLRQLQNAQQSAQQAQSISPHSLPQPQPTGGVHQQPPPQQANNTPQQTTSTGPPPTFNASTNTAAALLNQLRANSLNGANPAAALNPLNGLNLPNPAAALASQQPPNLPNIPALNQLAGLNPAAAASLNSPLNSLVPGLNPLSPPRPSLADYSSYYNYLAMARQNYYPLGNSYMSPFPFLMGMARKPKRVRTAFNPSQLLQLEQAFEKNQYVVGQERKQLANSLQLSETQVKVWFQNRRTKHKRLKTEGEDPCKSPLSDNNDKSSGDEEIEEDDTEIDPDGFNNEELKMHQLINSNFNPFANGFNLNQANRQAEFLYANAFAASLQAANNSQLRATSNSNSQSTTGLTAAQQS